MSERFESRYKDCHHCKGLVNVRERHVFVKILDQEYYFHPGNCIECTDLQYREWQANFRNNLDWR